MRIFHHFLDKSAILILFQARWFEEKDMICLENTKTKETFQV